ncbi:MAG: sigma-54-dependent Fis family transcriptional regulator [Desulfomonile tiedjei]|uniref:Sigma-54-dependent Fis family transcriptional regulator n=1 Tax=Desulfomonile tiedjei TaxID=2358 RepID=A0A9D6V3Y7_9BACT|nr:sigma-54-dependent Fis family transcriptional regulator [Desulfomonile tiedjei]
MNESSKGKLLILDDEEDMLRLLKRSLSTDLDCEISTASDAYQALALLQETRFDVALADIRMPGMDGMEFLTRIKKDYPELSVVMMTAYGSIDLAVQAIKHGAYDFITKPFEHDKLTHLLEKALERSRLVRENLLLQKRIEEQESFQEMVGSSPKMLRVFQTIGIMAKADATVLITGESGTGKDLAARAMHKLSQRALGPFVAVNCPNLPENILESELFGYKKGAFTHATQDRKGLFREAEGGTIYLDEIGDISPTLQTKLLRVLQDKEIRPLGQNKSVKVDVRIIASTNRDLEAKIQDGSFREDLFYRLNVLSLQMPPLRERAEDVPLLVEYLLTKFLKEFKKPKKTVAVELMHRFISHPWRGNVRELENVISRAVLLTPGDIISPEDVDWEPATQEDCLVPSDFMELPYKDAKATVLERFNREYISRLLMRHNSNVTRAAKECGLERQALQQVMRRYGIKSKSFQVDDDQIS